MKFSCPRPQSPPEAPKSRIVFDRIGPPSIITPTYGPSCTRETSQAAARARLRDAQAAPHPSAHAGGRPLRAIVGLPPPPQGPEAPPAPPAHGPPQAQE